MKYQVHFFGEGMLLFAGRGIKPVSEYGDPSEIPTFDTEETPITPSLKMMSEAGKLRIEFFRGGPILAARVESEGQSDEILTEPERGAGPLSKEEMAKLTVKELDEIAASLGVTNLRGLRKQEKIEKIAEFQSER